MFGLRRCSHASYSISSVHLRIILAQNMFNQIVPMPQLRPPANGDEWWAVRPGSLSTLTPIGRSRSDESRHRQVEVRLWER